MEAEAKEAYRIFGSEGTEVTRAYRHVNEVPQPSSIVHELIGCGVSPAESVQLAMRYYDVLAKSPAQDAEDSGLSAVSSRSSRRSERSAKYREECRGLVSVPGYCYLALVALPRRKGVSARLGPYPDLRALLSLTLDELDSSELAGLALERRDARTFHFLPASGGMQANAAASLALAMSTYHWVDTELRGHIPAGEGAVFLPIVASFGAPEEEFLWEGTVRVLSSRPPASVVQDLCHLVQLTSGREASGYHVDCTVYKLLSPEGCFQGLKSLDTKGSKDCVDYTVLDVDLQAAVRPGGSREVSWCQDLALFLAGESFAKVVYLAPEVCGYGFTPVGVGLLGEWIDVPGDGKCSLDTRGSRGVVVLPAWAALRQGNLHVVASSRPIVAYIASHVEFWVTPGVQVFARTLSEAEWRSLGTDTGSLPRYCTAHRLSYTQGGVPVVLVGSPAAGQVVAFEDSGTLVPDAYLEEAGCEERQHLFEGVRSLGLASSDGLFLRVDRGVLVVDETYEVAAGMGVVVAGDIFDVAGVVVRSVGGACAFRTCAVVDKYVFDEGGPSDDEGCCVGEEFG